MTADVRVATFYELTGILSLDSPREITFFIGPGIPQTGSMFLANGYLLNPKSQMRIPRMDLLCLVSQPSCYALIPGMTYGADAVEQGEADYVRTVPLALTPLYGCIRIYGPDHVYLYAVGTNKIVGIPTVDEAVSLTPVEEPAEVPRYEQPAHAYAPPVQYAPSAQAAKETAIPNKGASSLATESGALTGTYSGRIHNTKSQLWAAFGTSIREQEGNVLSGCVFVHRPLFGSGKLSGNSRTSQITFDVPSSVGVIRFTGNREGDGISGTYYVVRVGAVQDYGEFELHRQSELPTDFYTHDCPDDSAVH